MQSSALGAMSLSQWQRRSRSRVRGRGRETYSIKDLTNSNFVWVGLAVGWLDWSGVDKLMHVTVTYKDFFSLIIYGNYYCLSP